MMDRYLALVLGCPVLYDERDVTQHLPYCPGVGEVEEGQQDEAQRLIGSLAHIRYGIDPRRKLRQTFSHPWPCPSRAAVTG